MLHSADDLVHAARESILREGPPGGDKGNGRSDSAANLEPLDNLPLTEIGLAERLVRDHGADIRYCHASSTWYVWDGRHWAEDSTAEVERRAKSTIRALYATAAREPSETRRQAIAKFALRADGDVMIRRMLSRAAAEPGIPVTLDQFDAEPHYLNCPNGVVDLRTGRLEPHRRELLMRNLAGTEYDPEAVSPIWESFLHDTCGGDLELRNFLQVAFGYSATGDTCEEKLFMPIGPAATGKSTLLEGVKAALGTYAWVADFESFLHRPAGMGGIRSDVAELAGRRFVLSVEVDEGTRLAEGLVKHLTGGDTMRARNLYQKGFLFRPQCKLWLAANHAPRVRDDDSGLWRRILRIPLDKVVPEERRDRRLKERLRTDPECQRAILAWIVAGAVAWYQHGLAVPDCIRGATERYRQEQDPLRDFFAESCELDPDAWTPNADLRKAYEAHCEREGIRYPLGPRALAERLEGRGCRSEVRWIDGKAVRGWLGIRIL